MLKKLNRTLATIAALSALVMVSQAEAGNKLEVKGTDGTTTVFAVDDAGMVTGKKLGMGTATPQAPIHLNLTADPVGTLLYNASTGLAVSRQDGSAAADFTVADATAAAGKRGTLRGVRARGSLLSPSIPALNDQVFSVLGAVYTGQRVQNAADISMYVDGTISDGGTPETAAAPLRISFSTRPLGTVWYERMTVKNDGKIGVNTTSPTALFDVNSDTLRLRTSKTPASATAACNQGDISWDANFVYVCVNTNSWARAALSSW